MAELGPPQPPRPRRAPLHRLKRRLGWRFWVAIALLAALVAVCCGPLQVLLEREFLLGQLQQYGRLSALLFPLAYAGLTVLGVPGIVLTVTGGVVYGTVWGTVLSTLGATLGALAAFWIARYLLPQGAWQHFGQHRLLARFERAVRERPLRFVLSVRFAPIFPFNAVNYLFGLTPLPWTTYMLGTALGILPGSLVCSWLGASGERALQQGQLGPFWVALSLLALLSLLPLGWRQQPASRASGVSRMGDRDSGNPRKWYSMQPLRTLSDFGTSLFHRDYRRSAVRVALYQFEKRMHACQRT